MSRNGHNGEGLPGSLAAFMLSHLHMPQVQDYPRLPVPPEFHRNVPPELSAKTAEGKTLEAMLDNGLSLDEAAKAIKSLGENSTGIPPEFHRTIVKDPVAEKRRAYDRERKRRKKLAAKIAAKIPPENANARLYTNTSLPFLEVDTVKKESKSSGIRARVKRPAYRISEDWQPTEADLATARKYLPADRIPIEATKFKNYWLGRGDRKAVSTNWSLNWENWCVNALEYGGRNVRPGAGIPHTNGGSPRKENGAQRAERLEREAIARQSGGGLFDPGAGVVELDPSEWTAGGQTRTNGHGTSD